MNRILEILQYLIAKPQNSVRSIFWIKYWNWNLWLYTNTWILLLIKLLRLALVTLLAYVNYITKYSIIITIFWYHILASVANLRKHSFEDMYLCRLRKTFFDQMHFLITDFCLVLLNFKMSIIRSNWGFI